MVVLRYVPPKTSSPVLLRNQQPWWLGCSHRPGPAAIIFLSHHAEGQQAESMRKSSGCRTFRLIPPSFISKVNWRENTGPGPGPGLSSPGGRRSAEAAAVRSSCCLLACRPQWCWWDPGVLLELGPWPNIQRLLFSHNT